MSTALVDTARTQIRAGGTIDQSDVMALFLTADFDNSCL